MAPPETTPSRLEEIRDAVPAVAFAIETTRTWARFVDQRQPEDGGVHEATVERMLAAEGSVVAAFQAGYDGNVRYPITFATVVSDEIHALFGHRLYKLGQYSNAKQTSRMQTISRLITESRGADVGGANVQALNSLTQRIVGAHSIYQYLNRRVFQNYKEYAATPNDFRIMNGHEEVFWGGVLFGRPNSPGIFETEGVLAHFRQSIMGTAEELYGGKAQEFVDAWWAATNMHVEEGENLRDLMGGSMRALAQGDLGSARYAIKERLFLNPDTLPFRARSTFELDKDEIAYFTELQAAPAVLPEAPIESEQAAAELSREEELKLARDHLGALLVWTTNNGQSRAAYASHVGVDQRSFAVKREVIEGPDGPQMLVPYVLVMDHFRTTDNRRFTRLPSSVNRPLSITNFSQLVRTGAIDVIDVDDRYADRETMFFEIEP